MSFEKDGIKQIDKDELKNMLKSSDSDSVIIDVREPDEYHEGHIPGVPLVPMQTIPNLVEGFSKDKEYIFVCRSGNRSQNVSLFLKEQGLNQVTNYDGGMLAWDGDVASGEEIQINDAETLKKFK